jgi:hypothetical protein
VTLHETPPPTPQADGLTVAFVATGPLAGIAADSIRRIREAGGRVVLLCPKVPGYAAARGAADEYIALHPFGNPVRFDSDDDRPERWTSEWVATVATNLHRKVGRRVAHKVIGRPLTWGLASKQTPEALEVLERADVITALDPNAVYIAWRAGQTNQHAAIINGIGPTLEHLGLAR